VKYGFTLKQWFVNRGSKRDTYSNTLSWCNRIGYRMPSVRDLTNAVRTESPAISGATPSSRDNHYMRHIGSGFFAEWGRMFDYSTIGLTNYWLWTSDPNGSTQFIVYTYNGIVGWAYDNDYSYGLCSHP
ncbi:hypothetical protein, partial [Gilliamella sp. B3493]